MVNKFEDELKQTALKVASAGKGILAADESIGTIGKRFAPIDVENNQENRRKYRQFLFETKGLSEYISGAILFEETLFDKTPEGKPLVEILKENDIIPGIKVDKGQASIMNAAEGETSTQGLDGLGARCAEYYKQGARFAKWRAVIKIDASTGAPTDLAIAEQTNGLARYASICQENGLVPIVEPEVLMDGDHSIEVSAEVTERVWHAQFKALADHKVLFEGILLKPNMVRSGADCAEPADMATVAAFTLRTLQRVVPPAVPGINFLSGGMSEEEATIALNEINRAPGKKPWNISFSYGRALQASVLQEWKGSDDNIPAAQETLLARSKANGEAQLGKYGGGAGGAAANTSTYQKNYSY
ncbi:Fructose-bisphosphate aldolase [Hondaea fermentalgiana]|uniref:Fructose-bisphosphate aldolase n=1 Tax=Hondaea fermentalgiana TaxID=2315210 RepID=A0A2R5GTJ9_9STRA|nr:Fructose-bisphosphate aldolase [Hondaea fermentalgiana]|eukprot:GBG34196.1 Fructose-bisphosphate aldolase [Hondaea fermentalgiana]